MGCSESKYSAPRDGDGSEVASFSQTTGSMAADVYDSPMTQTTGKPTISGKAASAIPKAIPDLSRSGSNHRRRKKGGGGGGAGLDAADRRAAAFANGVSGGSSAQHHLLHQGGQGHGPGAQGVTYGQDANGGVITTIPPSPASSAAKGHWEALWKAYYPALLDPADVHSTIESLMARTTNKLSPAEITMLQRRVRFVIKNWKLTSKESKSSNMMGRIKSAATSNMPSANSNGSGNGAGDLDTRGIAEKLHLLNIRAIRKILPNASTTAANALASSSSSVQYQSMDTVEATYVMLLFLHESMWDRVAFIAEQSIKATPGLIMDVNKKTDQVPLPSPCQPLGEAHQTPPGVSLHALAFLTALALRGTRNQRLQLLFYLLLPPQALMAFLERHPAGGVPCWLLEVGSSTVLSLASLSHYHLFSDAFAPDAPATKNGSVGELPNGLSPGTNQKSSSDGDEDEATKRHDKRFQAQFEKSLTLNGAQVRHFLRELIAQPQPHRNGMSGECNGSSAQNKPHNSPVRKASKLSRRGSNQTPQEVGPVVLDQSEVMDRLNQISLVGNGLASSDPLLMDPRLEASREKLLGAEFGAEDPGKLSISDFFEWADGAFDDYGLSAVMSRLFATGILPSANLESEIVSNRWKEWHAQEVGFWSNASDSDGPVGYLSKSLQTYLSLNNSSPYASDSRKSFARRPFGGIGGFDGRGGTGYGVMYCVDKKWWDSWVAYVGWAWVGEAAPSSYCPRPGELSTERLLDRRDELVVPGTLGSYELMKKGLKKDVDYVLVPPGVWEILYELYGGGPPLPRMVLPPSEESLGHNIGATDSDVEVDAGYSSPASQQIPRPLPFISIETHPWILNFHVCDPQQPYRRAESGPFAVRVMALPNQPLWRLFAEVVARLPFHTFRIYGPDGRGKARLWKRTDPSDGDEPVSRYGPWSLICKNRYAMLPSSSFEEDLEDGSFSEIKQDWQDYAGSATVESAGIDDGNQLMVECAVMNKNNEFRWPREDAAKAGRVRELADKDKDFRNMLKGVNDKGEKLANPINLVDMSVDASDSSGRWFQVKIEEVHTSAADTDDDSTDMETSSGYGDGDFPEPQKDGTESASSERKEVRVDFSKYGGHIEWINVDGERLAVAGRYSQPDDATETSGNSSTNGPSQNDSRSKSVTVKRAPDNAENSKVCTYPGYGACGLSNLGNTCYANAAIQCIGYLPLLRAYLLGLQYKLDLNKDNPLGTGGKLLEEFAELLRRVWSGKNGELNPGKFRMQLGRARSQFAGADQQDAQEFLNYMMDVLHEDSNRVLKKPYVEGLEDDWVKGTPLPRVGEEAWRRFLRRNRSIMADIAMGQVLNTVTCPECNFSSRNFDPFNLLSIPFPSVADVIFRCHVIRRANAFNTPWVLNRPRKGGKSRVRFIRRSTSSNRSPSSPPNDEFLVEEYIIAMSRLADSSDLKQKVHELCGISIQEFRLCKAETIHMRDKDNNSIVEQRTKVTPLTDKDGPCSQFARPRNAAGEPPKPMLIIAFQSTLRSRPAKSSPDKPDPQGTTDEADYGNETSKRHELSKTKIRELEGDLKVYGNQEECRIHDTNPTLIAKAMSRSQWPRNEDDLRHGLRVDAIDRHKKWYSGSIVDIVEQDDTEGAEKLSNGSHKIKVRVHFDNFSNNWDEWYTIDQFTDGEVQPLYSYSIPRGRPTEFAIHHRFTGRATRLSNLFGQSFYMQCHNEWTTARAGAQILAQASRFLQQAKDTLPELSAKNGESPEKETKVFRLYERTQSVISDLIDILVEGDREYVHHALGLVDDDNDADSNRTKYRSPGFDASHLSAKLTKHVNSMLNRLPFDVRVCTADSPLNTTNEEVAFPFSLMRTVGNYMNARHAVVLHWREPPTDKKALNGKNSSYLDAPVMYVAPTPVVHEESSQILERVRKEAELSGQNGGAGGLQLGVCLSEFCKVQELSLSDNWRCPRCKEYREGKQSLDLWRLPDLLTIHMKRFNCSAKWREKISTKVNFPLTGLDMSEWCHTDSPVIQDNPKESYVYDLIGVLNHYGSMTGGHYVATCKATPCSREGQEEVSFDFNGYGVNKPMLFEDESDSQSGWRIGRPKTEPNRNKTVAQSMAKAAADSAEPLWLQFDDDLVEPIPPRFVVSEMAYVLFYRRRRLTPSNVAKYSTLM